MNAFVVGSVLQHLQSSHNLGQVYAWQRYTLHSRNCNDEDGLTCMCSPLIHVTLFSPSIRATTQYGRLLLCHLLLERLNWSSSHWTAHNILSRCCFVCMWVLTCKNRCIASTAWVISKGRWATQYSRLVIIIAMPYSAIAKETIVLHNIVFFSSCVNKNALSVILLPFFCVLLLQKLSS